MHPTRTKWMGVSAAAAVLLSVAGTPSHAQYPPGNPGYGSMDFQARLAYQRACNMARAASCLPGRHSMIGNPYVRSTSWGNQATRARNLGNSYAYWGSYGTPPSGYWAYASMYSSDPYGGYLRGAADVISAQSRYLVSMQEANLLREQVRARQLENKRSAFDHYLYVREHTPSFEQLRAEERTQRRDRARNDPPVTEIFSALSLNELLADLRQVSLTGVRDLPLDADIVRHVNVTATRNGAHLGAVRNAGRLNWPVLLQGEAYQVPRERLNALAQDAVGRLRQGQKVDAATLQQMDSDVEALGRKLREVVADAQTAQYIEARRFLNQLGDALKALERPDAVNFFNGRNEFRGKSASELVQFMTERGLWFAPATAGDEPAYTAVHQVLASSSMAAYANVLQASITKR